MLRYKNLGQGTYDQNELERAFREAEYFQEVRIDVKYLFHRTFLRVKYVPIDQVKRAFLRVETGESGDFPTQAVYLVLQLIDDSEVKLHMERYDTAKKMFAYLKENFLGISCTVTG